MKLLHQVDSAAAPDREGLDIARLKSEAAGAKHSANDTAGNPLLVGVLIALAIGVLFFIDAHNPRGVLDGGGYAAVVAMGLWIGRRAVLAVAVLTTALTITAFFLTPVGGVGMVGTLANRGFAIASIWIVAAALLRQMALERRAADQGAWFRGLFDQIPMVLSIHDLRDRFVQVNRPYEAWSGLKEADLVNRTREEVWKMQRWGAVPTAYIEEVRRTGAPVQTQPMKLHSKGQPRWIIGTVFPIRDAAGGLQAIGSAASDITELWHARDVLAAREAALAKFQRALADAVQRAGLFERSYMEAIHALTELAAEALEVGRTSVFHADLDADWIERVDTWDRAKGVHQERSIEPHNFFAPFRVEFSRDRVLAIENVDHEPRLAVSAALLQEHDIRSMLSAPIYVAEKPHGTLVFCHIGKTHQWTAEEMSFARSVADLIGMLVIINRHRETLAALDLIDESIYIEHDDGRVVYANQAVARLVGSADATAPQRRTEGIPAAHFPRPEHPLAGDSDVTEMAIDTETGRRELEISRRRLPRGGTIVVIADKTESNAELRERERLQEQLQQAGKMEAIGMLAGGIAHDFNNLLGAILGFARFLDEDLPPESDQHSYARRILSACHRGRSITSQILMFARSDIGAGRHADVGRVVRDSADILRGLMSSATEFRVEIGDGDMIVRGDEGQLVQLVANLCTNANTALQDRPGSVSVRIGRIAATALDLAEEADPAHRRRLVLGTPGTAEHYALIEVADTGGGIPPDILPRIFDPFFSKNVTRVGTGLGLAIVHRVVMAHKGAVVVESTPGTGSRFAIYLPLDGENQPDLPAEAPEPATTRGTERVLVVDDEVDITDALSIGLERLGYEVASANDPQEALADFTADPGFWDVVITDQRMPGLDGVSLVRAIKALRPGIKAILCTGMLEDDIPMTESSELDAVFMKPIDAEQVAIAIRTLLDSE